MCSTRTRGLTRALAVVWALSRAPHQRAPTPPSPKSYLAEASFHEFLLRALGDVTDELAPSAARTAATTLFRVVLPAPSQDHLATKYSNSIRDLLAGRAATCAALLEELIPDGSSGGADDGPLQAALLHSDHVHRKTACAVLAPAILGALDGHKERAQAAMSMLVDAVSKTEGTKASRRLSEVLELLEQLAGHPGARDFLTAAPQSLVGRIVGCLVEGGGVRANDPTKEPNTA